MADQAVGGESIRFHFWRKMFLPLVALLFVGNNVDIISWVFYASAVIYLIALIVFFGKDNIQASLRRAVQSSPGFAFYIISTFYLPVSFIGYYINKSHASLRQVCDEKIIGASKIFEIPECISYYNDDWKESIAAWEGVIISAALAYLILTYCISTSRQKNCPFPWVYQMLIFWTLFSLYFVTRAGVVKIESLIVYAETASLVALLCCAPHLYPGLNPVRSTIVVQIFTLIVLPITWIVVWLLMAYDMASNDTIIRFVDICKYCTGLFYLILSYGEFIVWSFEQEMEKKDKKNKRKVNVVSKV